MSRLIALAVAGALSVQAMPAWSDTPITSTRIVEEIAPQPLAQALDMWARRTGLQVIYGADLTKGLQSPGAHAGASPKQALTEILEGSGLHVTWLNERTASIAPSKPAAPSQSTTSLVGKPLLRVAQDEENGARSDANPQVSTASESEAQSLVVIDEVLVRGRPFTDANVDIVRTENDVQPYYIFKGDDIAKANVSNLEEFLKQRLTMNTVSSTQGQTAFRDFSSVNLRGLGLNQTLILVNGRRVAGAGPVGSNLLQFDINAFAPSMIDRVEVLPSSASAIYGGSAVGGVLNVVLKRDYTGGDFQIGYDTPDDINAPIRTVTGAYGWSLEDGRTNITVSASYRDSESLLMKDRLSLLERGRARVFDRAPGLLYSDSSPYGAGTTPNIASADGSELVFRDGTSLGSSLTYIPAGTSAATSAAQLQAGLLANAGQQNTTLADIVGNDSIGLRYPFSGTSEAKSFSGAVRRRFTDRLELIAEVFYNSNQSKVAQPYFAQGYVPADAPTNPFDQDVVVSLPLAGYSTNTSDAESLRAVVGFVVDLPYDWRMQGDYTWNRNDVDLTTKPGFDYASGQSAAPEAMADGTLNPFVDTLAFPLDLTAYTGPDSYTRTSLGSSLADIGLRLSGPLGDLPAGAPVVTVGLGHRKEKIPTGYDDISGYGLRSFLPQSQTVTSVYSEAFVPLISPSMEMTAANLLELQLAARLEDFSVSTGTAFRTSFPPDYEPNPNDVLLHEDVDYRATSWTAGLRFRPVESLTLRASYATAFLPPGFSDLLPSVIAPGSTIRGVDPRRGNEVFNVPFARGGNPDLDPMDATSLDIGLLFEPTFIEGLRLGVEWFRLERENLIFRPTLAQLLLNESQFPERVTRGTPPPGDPFGVGAITFVDFQAVNAAHVSTDGFDVSLGYRRDLADLGSMSFDVLGTFVESFTQQVAITSPETEIAGQLFNSAPLKVRVNASLGWQRGPWSAAWSTLYYGPYDQNPQDLYVQAQGGTTVPHQMYHNFQASYRFAEASGGSFWNSALSNVTVTLGVRNVFDKEPPFDANALRGEYFYSYFGDSRLRSVQLTVGKRL